MRYPLGVELLVYPELFPAGFGRARPPRAWSATAPRRAPGWGHELHALRAVPAGRRSARRSTGRRARRPAVSSSRSARPRRACGSRSCFDNAVGRLTAEAERERFEQLVSEAATAAVDHLDRGFEVELVTRDRHAAVRRGTAAAARGARAAGAGRALSTPAPAAGADRSLRPAAAARAAGGRRGVTFAREKRLLLGVAAFLVAWPLPLNDALDWPALALFVLAVAWALRRAWLGAERWLSNRALNLLGLAYLPVLVLDVAVLGRVQLVRPVLHLTLFGVAAKLWSLSRERDKWQAWIGIFFLFLAAMATSVHPSVVLYLAAFLALTVAILVRFVYLHVLSSFGHRDSGRRACRSAASWPGPPRPRCSSRCRSSRCCRGCRPPTSWPARRAGRRRTAAAGFSDEMSLDLIGRIRDNREVALRLELAGRYPPPERLRFKAATYDRWEGRTWRRSRGARTLRRDTLDGMFRLSPAPPVATAHDLPRAAAHHQPAGAGRDARGRRRGACARSRPRGRALAQRACPTRCSSTACGSAPSRFSAARRPTGEGDPALDPTGVTDRIGELARRWAGEGDAGERARGASSSACSATTATRPSSSAAAATRRSSTSCSRRGAGTASTSPPSMVLLLRAEGIPARLVTGFYGAECSSWDRGWVVRQSNAHAWVEAWLPAAAGRPSTRRRPPAARRGRRRASGCRSARRATRWSSAGTATSSPTTSTTRSASLGEPALALGPADAQTRRARGVDPGRAAGKRGCRRRAGGGAPATSRELRPGCWPAVVAFALLAAALGACSGGAGRRGRATAAYQRLRAALTGAGVPTPPVARAARLRPRSPPPAAQARRRRSTAWSVSTWPRASPAARPATKRSRPRAPTIEAVEAAVRALRRRRGRADVAYSGNTDSATP